MTFTIISVGSVPKNEIHALAQDYIKRLPKNIHVTWTYIKHARGDLKSSIDQESDSILRTIPDNNFIILLDEKGEQLSSPELSKKIFSSPNDICFIIGGAYGVNEKVKSSANFIWSLSGLVFPHKLVRLMLSEQLYRSYAIHSGHPYHHN